MTRRVLPTLAVLLALALLACGDEFAFRSCTTDSECAAVEATLTGGTR